MDLGSGKSKGRGALWLTADHGGKGEREKFTGSQRSGLVYSFGPGWLYTGFIFNCYLNIALVKNALAQLNSNFWF